MNLKPWIYKDNHYSSRKKLRNILLQLLSMYGAIRAVSEYSEHYLIRHRLDNHHIAFLFTLSTGDALFVFFLSGEISHAN